MGKDSVSEKKPKLMKKSYIPFGRPDYGREEIQAVTRILRSGWIGMGSETIKFEKELARRIHAPHVVAVGSCTAAMMLSLHVFGVGKGDEVICPSLTWCSTANVVLYQGARPVFCDIDPTTFCVTPGSILEKVTPRTKAVMVVHFGGFAVDVLRLRLVLPKHIAIIEDAAHAFGARYPNGELVGSSGNLVCFSFYANKNLSTAEGGAVALFDQKKADKIRSLRQHGLPIDAWKRFTHPKAILFSAALKELGYKANYTDLQAALGRVQLRRFSSMQSHRSKIAAVYGKFLKKNLPWVLPQASVTCDRHAKHLFPIRIRKNSRIKRNWVLRELRKKGIGATVHYAPLHKMPLYENSKTNNLPFTEEVGAEILTLPISASIQRREAIWVCKKLVEVLT